ncbi:thioesterase II family protein [Streptomyces antarcticus]|uniref:thioesterase II family protein n=1 Tax=Streptomyces antarcticus TaxID=2996458 RepID=UPI002270F049|nr:MULTISPECIES: alpha/beta fold hydrolase [unclassified Streptomyces]MCY0941353.1 alpha/beta fold hydrolase [Streptomyces sp. H34-AA3]MCZ4084779.1 alpha/beta fold hydrolase [Streptomyces sp. H34-S5]
MGAVARPRWLRRFVPRPGARLRLLCFPHAGGAASAFHGLARALPEEIEVVAVQYPGRQDRLHEPVPAGLAELAQEVLRAVEAPFDRPTAFFGHSMGALVAYEAARRLEPRFPSPLAALFVSACKAPGEREPRGFTFSQDEMRAYLGELGGAGARAVEDEELWQLVHPVLSGDLRLTERYRHVAGAPLTCPVIGFAGESDAAATPGDVALWGDYGIGKTEVNVLPGGHFYYEQSLPALAAELSRRMGELPLTRG